MFSKMIRVIFFSFTVAHSTDSSPVLMCLRIPRIPKTWSSLNGAQSSHLSFHCGQQTAKHISFSTLQRLNSPQISCQCHSCPWLMRLSPVPPIQEVNMFRSAIKLKYPLQSSLFLSTFTPLASWSAYIFTASSYLVLQYRLVVPHLMINVSDHSVTW